MDKAGRQSCSCTQHASATWQTALPLLVQVRTVRNRTHPSFMAQKLGGAASIPSMSHAVHWLLNRAGAMARFLNTCSNAAVGNPIASAPVASTARTCDPHCFHCPLSVSMQRSSECSWGSSITLPDWARHLRWQSCGGYRLNRRAWLP
jgi:hypothetical protein